MMDEAPDVSIIIATYGRGPDLVEALRSVLAHESAHTFEVVVVDQTDDHPAPIRTSLKQLLIDERLRYIRAGPPSLPAARNLGVAIARAAILVFIDDDVLLDEGFLDGHVVGHQIGDAVAGVGGRTRTQDDRPTDRLFTLDRWGRNSGEFDYPHAGWLVTARGCNMSYKRAWLNRVGGFDTRFTGNAYREESDLCLRLGRAGGRIRYEPAASLLHLEGQAGGCRESSAIHDRALAYQNETLFFLKNWSKWALPPLLIVNFFSYVVTRYTRRQGLIPRRLAAWAKGVAAGIAQYRSSNRLVCTRLGEGLR